MNATFTCPVCGYPQLPVAPRSASGSASFEYCPSCGFQFGVTDDDKRLSPDVWRDRWVTEGMVWSAGGVPPSGWDPEAQLAGLSARRQEARLAVTLGIALRRVCDIPDDVFIALGAQKLGVSGLWRVEIAGSSLETALQSLETLLLNHAEALGGAVSAGATYTLTIDWVPIYPHESASFSRRLIGLLSTLAVEVVIGSNR